MNRHKAFRYTMAAGTLVVALLTLGLGFLVAADAIPALTLNQKEAFLSTAKIVKAAPSKKGVTGTVRLTLSDGTITHDASVQRIDEFKTTFTGQGGSTELNFRDSYKFNIAAWKLARLLGLDDMAPPSVERSYEGQKGSFTWWLDDIMMDESERIAKKLQAPDHDSWAKELNVMYVFDQLIYDTDANATNILFDKQWRLWMIDHTRAFRLQKTLLNPKVLNECDRNLLAKMKMLDETTLQKELTPWLSREEIRSLLARRDLIVKFFESKGSSALFDRPSRT